MAPKKQRAPRGVEKLGIRNTYLIEHFETLPMEFENISKGHVMHLSSVCGLSRLKIVSKLLELLPGKSTNSEVERLLINKVKTILVDLTKLKKLTNPSATKRFEEICNEKLQVSMSLGATCEQSSPEVSSKEVEPTPCT